MVTWSRLQSQGHDDGEVAHEGVDGGVNRRQTAVLTMQGLTCDLLYTALSRSESFHQV